MKAAHFFQLLRAVGNIGSLVGRDAGYDFRFHVQDAAFGAFLFLQILHDAPELVGCFSGRCEEGFIAVVATIVHLDEVADIDIIDPVGSFKTTPFVSHGSVLRLSNIEILS